MNNLPTLPERRRTGLAPWALAIAACAFFASASIGGCGGGVGEGGTGYASGPITGFGSIIVNEIVFDDSAAQVEDGDGIARARNDLRLGMTVEVDSDAIRAGTSHAARVRYDSAITGAVERVDAGSFVVLGQRVAVDETTVFDNALAAGLSALAPGQLVEVYALFDAGTASYRATRVERRAAALLYRLRGVVAEVDERTRTLRIGTALFAYGGASSTPNDLVAGSFVRLMLANTPDAFGRWPVLRFGEAQRALGDVADVSVKGHVTQYASAASFRVDGRPVDATRATLSGGVLGLGARVEVSGSQRGGVLVASAVVVRSDQFERERGFELRGPIESVAADRTSMVLRGITVDLTRPGLVYEDGSAAALAAGRVVEVHGVVSAGDATRLDAQRVRFR
jgi:hypothetical protein